MAFNVTGQYTGNYKTWDHLGNIIPNVEWSEGERPAGEFRPAAWLPLKFYDKFFEQWAVILPGKAVAFDNDGNLVPAGLATATTIVYTQNDVDNGVVDVTTGEALTETKTVTLSAVDGSPGFMGRSGVALAISKPVGFAPYTYLQWAGGDGVNPTQLRLHNYNMQNLTAVLCDYVLCLPLVPQKMTAAESLTFSSPSSNISTSDPLGNLPVAKNTMRTPFTFAGGASATLFVNEQDTADDVTAAGDWHVDLETGVITVYAASQPTSITLVYYFYGTGETSVTSAFASVKGAVVAGDFLKVDADSNLTLADPDNDLGVDIVGQVLEVITFPRADLDKVRTAYSPALNTSASGSKPGYAGQMDQLPGSATGGVPDAVHFSGAANLMVTVNLIGR